MSAFHRLDIAAVLLGEHVHEHDRFTYAGKLIKPHGNPLVPPGDEDELGVDFEGSFPLLGNVESVMNGVRAGVLSSTMPASAVGVRLTEGAEPFAGAVLPDPDGHLLGLARRVAIHVLGVYFEPAPLVRSGRSPEIVRLRRSKGEEAFDLVADLGGVGEYERLAFPLEPEVGVQPGLVQVGV